MQCSLNYCHRTSVKLPAGAVPTPVSARVYEGSPLFSWLHALIFTFLLTRSSRTVIPPLSVAIKIAMASASDAIDITDDERSPMPQTGSSRPRRSAGHDYYEIVIIEVVDNENDTTVRKRKRIELGSRALVLVPHKIPCVLN